MERMKEKMEAEKTTEARENNLQQYHAIKTASRPLHSHLSLSPATTLPRSNMHTAIEEKRLRLGEPNQTTTKNTLHFLWIFFKILVVVFFFFKPIYRKNRSNKGRMNQDKHRNKNNRKETQNSEREI